MNAPFASSLSATASPLCDTLWALLCTYEVGPAAADLSFVQRLARENGWTDAHAARVFEEYRRFLYLAVTAPHPVTPSDAVDQAWHLHLTYTRDYWERLCPEVLGRALHHGPTMGGRAEGERFFEQYALTLRSYEAAFGPAPADIWPDARRRLLIDPMARRVHPHDALILPWRWLFGGGLLALLMYALWSLL
ncbi:glycine-rich domain-containing protein [Novosphingobium sp.]|uniref:glycine-rich domain-containing protein n=1 Tax=Novosphingobium sp. TaxID=1874826 RepID=UPI003BAA4217